MHKLMQYEAATLAAIKEAGERGPKTVAIEVRGGSVYIVARAALLDVRSALISEGAAFRASFA